MSISMYDLSVPVFTKMIPALGHLLSKAEADAGARRIDPGVFLRARLAPDMHDFTRQVQMCTDHVKGSLSRLAGIETPSWPDDESSFAELHARLEKTLKYAEGFEREQLEGSETRKIELRFPQATFSFEGFEYLSGFVLPNFYFHMTTAYDILRHNGVQIGKRDFFGG